MLGLGVSTDFTLVPHITGGHAGFDFFDLNWWNRNDELLVSFKVPSEGVRTISCRYNLICEVREIEMYNNDGQSVCHVYVPSDR